MTIKHLLTTTAATLAFGAAVGAPTNAQAQSLGCAEINGFSLPFFDVLVGRMLTDEILDEGEVVTVTADSVDLFMQVAIGPVWNFSNLVGNIESPRFPESGTPISESWTIPINGITGLVIEANNGADVNFTNFNVSCAAVLVPVLGVPVGDVAQITISTQHGIINTALTRTAAAGLRGASGDTVSRGLTFLSTNGHDGGVAQPLNAWVSFGVRGYFDRLEGETTHLTFGADYSMARGTLLGVMVGIDDTSLENSAGQSTDSDSLLVGIYGAHALGGDLIVEGYVAHASVDYENSGGTSFGTDRTLAGLTLSGEYALSAGTVTPRARFWGTWEDFPIGVAGLVGGTSKQMQASVGAEILYNGVVPGTALAPFASLDLEYGQIDEVGLASDDFIAPRVGVGVTGALGGGMFHAGVDAGRSASDVTDVGLDLSFELNF